MEKHKEPIGENRQNGIPNAKTSSSRTPNVPALRFPEFTEEWEKCKLGDITINFNLRNKDRISYPMYSVTNNKGFVPQSEQFEDRDMIGEDIKAYKIIHKNDFAYNPARINVGSISKYNGDSPCMISSLYVCFKACNRVDADWLMQLLKTSKMNFYYNVNGEGGVRIYLFYPNFARISTSFPIIAEQKKIAKFLSLLDERIDTQNKIIEKLETLIKGIRDYVLNNKLQESTRKKLGELCSITTGKLDANAMKTEGLYPFFTCAEEVYRIDNFAFDTEALLISGNGANLGYIHYYKGKFNAYQRTYVLSDFIEDVHFIQIYLEAYLHKRIALEKSTSNTPYIVLATLTEMPIVIPNIKVQKDISNKILLLKSKLMTEIHIRSRYNDMRQFLLSQMFI